MNESTKTKKALRGSLFALFLCIVLLIGTTFAWFTDTASTGVNKIQSGNLKVGLEYKDANGKWQDATKTTLDFVKAKEAPAGEAILWEPGCKYKLPEIRVVNKGNLALKWKVKVNKGTTDANKGDYDLLDVIDFYLVTKAADGTETETSLDEFTGNLKKTETSGVYYIKGVMHTTAGNEYQGLTLDGITITVYATQDTVESDSFDNQYDANATSADELKDALKNGGDINVSKDIYTSGDDNAAASMTISKPTTLNLDAKIISPDNMGNNGTNFCALIVDADTTINATKDGGIDTGVNGGYGINVRKGANLTINNGYYYGGGTAVQVQKGTVTITGGTFACEPFGDPYGYNFLINCIDAAYKDGTAKVIIKGGTFINFDPSNNSAEGAGTNFLADGYKVVPETQPNGDIWYTVVAE